MRAAHLVTEELDLLVHVVGILLQLAQRFVLSGQSSEELVLIGLQLVFSEGAGLFGLLHRAERTRHAAVASLLSLQRLLVELLDLLELI